MTLDLDSMTWTCNVCGDTRPDALIGVAKRQGSIPAAVWNIRFCIDRLACVEYAQRPGEWTGPADRYRVDVPVTGVDIEDLDQVERIVQRIPYETMWTSVSGVTRAVVLLADASLEEAISHATATSPRGIPSGRQPPRLGPGAHRSSGDATLVTQYGPGLVNGPGHCDRVCVNSPTSP